VRARPDRKTPNSLETIEAVLLRARNPWMLEVLTQKISTIREK